MGRKQVFPPGDAVNPLQRMLGTYLRLERTRLGYSSSDVADRLGLSDTYLRLAESGRASLNQSLVFKVIEVFADSNAPTHDSRTISFSRFAQFMVGMHWVGAEMAAQTSNDEAGRRAFEDLAVRVGDFQVLFERTKRYFDLKDDEQRSFLEDVAAPEVGEFLRSRSSVTDPDEDEKKWSRDIFAMRDLLDIPTLNIDILLDLKQALAGRPFVHTAEIAAKWETQRASQFRSVRGLFRASTLVSKSNLDEFHYEFLSEKRFAQVRLIFTDSSQSAGVLKKNFIAFVNSGRKRKAWLAPLTPEEIGKIHFVALTEADCLRHQKALADLRHRVPADGREGYWSFETHSGLHIGFVGQPDENPASTLNLNLRDSFGRARLFEHLWSDVKSSR